MINSIEAERLLVQSVSQKIRSREEYVSSVKIIEDGIRSAAERGERTACVSLPAIEDDVFDYIKNELVSNGFFIWKGTHCKYEFSVVWK